MDSSDAIGFICLVVLLALSAFFSSTETALSTVNRMRLRSLASDGNKKAQAVLDLLENQSKIVAAILVGNNIANMSASSLTTSLVIKIFGNAYIGIATGLVTFAVLIFSEISPKVYAARQAEKIVLRYIDILRFIKLIFTPIVLITNSIANLFLKLFGVDPNAKDEIITEDELRTIVAVSHQEGVIEQDERKMIDNVVDFGDALAKDVMIPRIDMTAVEVNSAYEELIEIFQTDMYTRMPIYEETVDNVIGMVNMKDLLVYNKRDEDFSIRDFMRETYYTYEYKKTSELFVDMRQNTVNMAIVLDEYGATAGLITLEDLLEEIVGEIRDEFDAYELESVQKVGENEYLVDGNLKLDDLNDLLDLNLESKDYDSIGGIVIGRLEHLPCEGEDVYCGGTHIIVEKVDKNRIERIRLILKQQDPALESGGKE